MRELNPLLTYGFLNPVATLPIVLLLIGVNGGGYTN